MRLKLPLLIRWRSRPKLTCPNSFGTSHKCRLCDRMHPLDRLSDFQVRNVDMRKRKCAKNNHTFLHVDPVVKTTSNRGCRSHNYWHRSRHSSYYRPTENASPEQVRLVGLLSFQFGVCLSPTLLVKSDAFCLPSIVKAVLEQCSRQGQICSSLLHSLRIPNRCGPTVTTIYVRPERVRLPRRSQTL